MQTPNNNQGPVPPFPGSNPSQIGQQNTQKPSTTSSPSSSPFANPPLISNNNLNGSDNSAFNPPMNQVLPPRPQFPSMSNPVMNARPPFPAPRPPMQGHNMVSPIAQQSIQRPPTSYPAPPMPRPSMNHPVPLIQQPPTVLGNPFTAPSSQITNDFMHSSINSPQRPPQMVQGAPMVPQSLNRPPMPFIRPPMPSTDSLNGPPMPTTQSLHRPPMPPQHLNRPPMRPQGTPIASQPLTRPPMPLAQQASSPGSNVSQYARPPLPANQQSPVLGNQQIVRPPMPMRPPMPNPSGGLPNPQMMPMRPPPMPLQNNFRPPINNPMPRPAGMQPPPVNSMPPSGIISPSMKYPVGPGYQQQAPLNSMPQQQQQHGYPQQSGLPPTTQQVYPSYPQTSHSQGSTQYPNSSYANGNVAPQPAAPKVNPAAIPSVVSVLEADEARFKESGQPFFTFSSILENPPPLPTTRSVSIVDDGNSSPQFIRSTLNHIPVSEEIRDNSKIPLGLLIQPFASSPQSEVPLADFGEAGPLRCNRCRAYINPHVQFIKGGRYFVCNLCEMSNEVPEGYYANLDMSGKRIDLDLRPELKYGTVDFIASKEYLNRPAGKPHILFVLDSSRAAVGSGAFHASIEAIKAFSLHERAVKYYGGMAILIHDRTLTFYTLKEGSSEPQILVMGDVFDPFVPLHANDLYFDPIKCSSALSVLLNHLSTSITVESRPVDSSFGAAVSVAFESLKVRGGRAVFFQTTLPSYGPGALKNRESGGAPNSSTGGAASSSSDKANPLLFPQGDFYSKLAVQAAEQGISMSLVATPSAHIDLATLGVLANTTSGSVLHYSRFTAQIHMNRLVGDVLGLLSNSFAFDCLARIRCNSGLQVRRHYGHFFAASNGHDLSFGSISNDQSFAAFLEYDGKLSEKQRVSFQVALLHTDAFSGQRRIRVLNLSLPCTSSIQTIFRMSELDSILAFYLKKNVSQILEAPAAAFPASFTAKCVNILAAYRKYCAANMSSGQLILPDSLKLFPVMTLAIHKDAAFNGAPISSDARWNFIHKLSDLSLSLTITHFYPQLFPLINILDHGEILPSCIRLSREHLTRDGMYLLNNGNTLTLYIGDSVQSEILNDLFGVNHLNAVSLTSTTLPILQNGRSAKLRQIITVLRSQHSSRHLNLRIIRQSVDIAEDAEFSSQLIEDSSSMAASYVDFLCRVHSQIQSTIAQGSSLSLAERTSILSFLQ